MIFINLVTDTMLLINNISSIRYTMIGLAMMRMHASHASKLCLRKRAEYLDFDNNLLLIFTRMRRQNGESYVSNMLEKSEKQVY